LIKIKQFARFTKMALDINSEEGQKSLEHEREVQKIIEKAWNVSIIETPKLKASKCDGFLVRDNNIIALFETKCRYDMTYSELLDRGTWLVTLEKIEACKQLSTLLHVPFLGFLYLRPKRSDERILLFWKITNMNGDYVFEFERYEQETQRTINGGSTIRMNAYLPIEHSDFVKSVKRI
jgi:hypothetical protein